MDPSAPRPLTYECLTKRHPEYQGDQYTQIEDLYEGGWQIMRKAQLYLKPLPMEHPALYDSRCRTTAYVPYFGEIVDQFVSDLFSQPLAIVPAGDAKNPDTPGEFPDPEFYAAFTKDVDGEGNGLPDIAADLLTTALKHRRAYLMVDAPPGGDAPAVNRAEEEARGQRRCYAYEVSPDQVIDWKLQVEKGPDGKKTSTFAWVILYRRECERETPFVDRELVTETFTIWSMDGEVARWDQYAITYKPGGDNDPTRQRDVKVPYIDGDLTSFDRIPLLRFELPRGLWVGNKIGPLALEHWVRRSELLGAQKRSCVSIPWVSQGPEIPKIGEGLSEAAENPNRGDDPVKEFHKTGFMKLGHQDKLDFAEPHGHSYEILDRQIDHVRESMFAVNHQMSASIRPSAGALGRSGLSKQKDQDKTDKVLGALGRSVRTFFTMVYDTVAKARRDNVVWVASGIDNYETYDRTSVVAEAVAIPAVGVHSATFRKEHEKRVAAALVPGLPPATVAVIADEIDRGVDSEQEKRELQLDLDKQTIKLGPKTPEQFGQKPPGPKAPGDKDSADEKDDEE